MIFALGNEKDRQDFRRYCNDLYLWGCEKGGVVEIKKRHRPRSLAQNNYLHVILGLLASELGNTLEEVKYDYFKKHCNPDIFVHERQWNGKMVKFVRSTSSLDTEEMTVAIERYRNFVAKEFGWNIPSPEDHEAILKAEQQIARYAEYL